MAKQKAKRPETKTVTLSTGTNVTGPVAAIDKMVKGDRGGKAAKRSSASTAKPAPEPTPEPETQGTDATPEPSTAERPSRGASLAAWASFADGEGFQYPEGASRDEIRDAYEAAHADE